MSRLIHLSDLHFPRIRPALIAPLIGAINAKSPDLVVISGDFTQRARAAEFQAARDFLSEINAPTLCVPGNHDIPLFNLPARFLAPFAGYKNRISPDLAPFFDLPDLRVIGLNTVTPLRHQGGRIAPEALAETLRHARPDKPSVLVTHHPFRHAPEIDKDGMLGAEAALPRLAAANIRIILSGHLHVWSTDLLTAADGHAPILQNHAGTGLSSRLRGQDNDFGILDYTAGALRVTRMVFHETAQAFQAQRQEVFILKSSAWKAAAPHRDVIRTPVAAR